MWGRIYPHATLLILANIILKASCKGNGSLTFVIDNTVSMYDDIAQVKTSVENISNIVFNEKSSQISNMVLVTFKDPEATVMTVTTNRQTFKRTLNAVYTYNIRNRDCWEPSMKGLRLALETSNRDSYIYVFTDAPAKDYGDSHYVKELCQKKQTQIVFVLTGNCDNRYGDAPFDVYFDIAHACSGQAFEVEHNQVHEVLRTIEETIKGNKTVFTSTIVPAGVEKHIPFTIDDHTDYAIVSVSGKDVHLGIKGPSFYLEKIMWNNNGKVAKLNNAKPGAYVATVKGQKRTSVVIVGRTDFYFKHGFSELNPKSPGDTSLQPIAKSNVHLSISVTDDHHSVQIVSAQILDMNENPIYDPMPIRETSKDFYVTNLFAAPSQRFKVAVNGIVKATGKSIKRIGKIPITPQEPPIKLPNNKKPTVKITEGKTIEIEYNSTMKLTCNVDAFPEPKIVWANMTGHVMPSKMSIVELPYKYISYMDLSYASKGDRYKCYAANDVGRDERTINVDVKEPFTVKSTPSGITKLSYGKEGIFTCDITSHLPIEIHWYYANELTGHTREILTSDKYEVSANRTQLKIKKMDLDLVGIHACRVFLKNNRDERKDFLTRVLIDGLIAPKVKIVSEVKVTTGKTAVIECKVQSGVPVPKITWLFGGKLGSKFTPIGSGSMLRITNVDDKHEGKYKCVAENAFSQDEQVTTLMVQDLPKITTSSSVTYKATEGDDFLKIPCVADAVPKPTIIWKLSGRNITPNAKYSIENGTLIIIRPTVNDTNSYTCEAKNEVGVVSATFKTYIRKNLKISGVNNKKVKIGSPASIECRVEGEPKPTITWQFMNNSSSNFLPIPGSNKELNIPRVEIKDAGRYKCIAKNEIAMIDHITTLEVQDLPKIVSINSTTYQSIEGDALLKIPCVTAGLPKPTITWKLNGRVIDPSGKYSVQDEALIIRDLKVSDTNSYTCEAKNEVGTVSVTFKTYIHQPPKLSGVASKTVTMGNPTSIDCMIVKGEPKPNITWQFMDKFSSKFVPIAGSETTLRITNAETKHAGSYMCIAQNDVGNDEHMTTLIVKYLPKITTNSSMIYQATEGDAFLKIPCVADGVPKPVIIWKLSGRNITPSAKYSIETGALIIRGPTVSDTNSYTCEAKNEVGAYSATFKTYIRQAPKLSGVATKKIKIGSPATIECKVEGEPKPTITWQFMDNSSSNFLPIPGSNKVLNIPRAEIKHAGSYKCVAQNIVGKNDHITTVEVQDLPTIVSSNSTTYQSIEGDALLKIPCATAGLPKPTITWKLNERVIDPSGKYSIQDGALIIRDLKVNDTNSYTCEAKNEVGTVSVTFKTYIRQLPKLSGVASKNVRMGYPTSIECTIVKGEPKPKMSWQYMDKSTSKFVPIDSSETTLRITKAEKKHAGTYKCVAQNSVGTDEHITSLIVEHAPGITTNSSTVEGIVGDLALRIPCDVVGVPKPNITWKSNGTTITPNAKYSIEDGALIIMKPTEKDTSSYMCEAKNHVSTVSVTFQAKVYKYPKTSGTVHYVYLKTGESRKLKCEAYNSTSQSIKWFITTKAPDLSTTSSRPETTTAWSTGASNPLRTITQDAGNKEQIQIASASATDHDGNYTCHVSDKHGKTQTHTYVVDVGITPKFRYDDNNSISNWRGDIKDITQNCDIYDKPKPIPMVEWRFNGKLLTDLSLAGVGNYTCNVSNVHGSVLKRFEVKSLACLITRIFRDTPYLPLVLNDEGSWHKFETSDYYTIVEQEEKIILSCPSQKETSNAFKSFPEKSTLEAICYKEDAFLVDDKIYKLSDLQCTHSVEPSVVNKKAKCSTETSELLSVGYNVPDFLEAYEVCFDRKINMPLYTRILMSDTNTNGANGNYNWYTYPGIGSEKTERGFTCKDASSSCCYSKSQLVNAIDFNDGPAKKSTFIDPLNVIPVWIPCNTSKSSWEAVNDMVRSQLPIYIDIVVWSGTHTFQEKNGAVIPRYLWKVVRLIDDEVMAIVHVNDPNPTNSDIKCNTPDFCEKYDWIKSDDSTYCCSLPDFLKSFDIHVTDIGESIDAVLDEIEEV